MSRYVPIRNIDHDSFDRYGRIMEFSEGYPEAFEIIVREREPGWRLAIFKFYDKKIKVIENHPASMESFEPLKGIALLLVAENANPADYEVFLLDKPVCLNKGTWHQVISLTKEAQVKIAENDEVATEFFELPGEIAPGVIGL